MVQVRLFSSISQITSKLSFTQSGSKSESRQTSTYIRSRPHYSSISQGLIRTIKSLRFILYTCTVEFYPFSSPCNYSLLSAFSSFKSPLCTLTSLRSFSASLRRFLLRPLFFPLLAHPFYRLLVFPSTMRGQDIPAFLLTFLNHDQETRR
jgi:hypothetical protein